MNISIISYRVHTRRTYRLARSCVSYREISLSKYVLLCIGIYKCWPANCIIVLAFAWFSRESSEWNVQIEDFLHLRLRKVKYPMGFCSITERDNFNVTNKRWWDKLSKPGRRSEIDLVGDFVKQSKRRWAEFRYFVACNYYNDVILLASLVSKLTGGESHWNWTLAVWVRFPYQLTARKNHCIQKSVRK